MLRTLHILQQSRRLRQVYRQGLMQSLILAKSSNHTVALHPANLEEAAKRLEQEGLNLR